MYQPLHERLCQATKYRGWDKNTKVMANKFYAYSVYVEGISSTKKLATEEK